MKRFQSILLMVVVAAALGWALYRLFDLRFSSGDVYPPYSTFRADPLGSRALFEGFATLTDRETRQLLEDLDRVDTGRETTLFVLGLDAEFDKVPESDAKDLEKFLREGGRVVMSLYPEMGTPYFVRWRAKQATNSPPTGTNSIAGGTNAPSRTARSRKRDQQEETLGFRLISLRERWGFGVGYEKLSKDEENKAKPVKVWRTNDATALPDNLDWHSAAFFTPTNAGWRPVYTRDKRPVLMERAFGRGTIVLASDSYFASNEALRKARETALLSWLAGSNTRILFDETHLGVQRDPGIMMLARRYRLHGLFASLLLLAGLFIWKNAASFVPAHADTGAATEVVSGKDSAAGFVNLLRRSIPPRDILNICFAEWTKSLRHRCHYTMTGIDQAQAVMENARTQSGSDPITVYQNVARALKTSDFPPPSAQPVDPTQKPNP